MIDYILVYCIQVKTAIQSAELSVKDFIFGSTKGQANQDDEKKKNMK